MRVLVPGKDLHRFNWPDKINLYDVPQQQLISVSGKKLSSSSRVCTALQARKRSLYGKEKVDREEASSRITPQSDSKQISPSVADASNWGDIESGQVQSRRGEQRQQDWSSSPSQSNGKNRDKYRSRLPTRTMTAGSFQKEDASPLPRGGHQHKPSDDRSRGRPQPGGPNGSRMPESFQGRGAQFEEARPANAGNRNGNTGADLSESQVGWAAFTRQQTGKAEPQSANLLRNGAQNGAAQAPGAAKERPWQALADSQRARASSQTMSHKERMQVALFCNKIMVNAFRKFAAAVGEARHLPDESQLVLQDFVHEIQHVLSQNRQNLDDVNIATALYQLQHAYSIVSPQGQNYAAAGQLLPQLVSQAGKMVEKFKLDSVIMTVSALAKLSDAGHGRLPFPATVSSDGGAQIQELVEQLAERAYARIKEPPDVQPHQMAVLMWAYGRLGVNPMQGKLFELVDQKCRSILRQFDAQNLANLMVAAGHLDYKLSDETYTAVATEATLKMPRATAQGVGNLLWGFSKMRSESPLGGDLFRSAFSRISEIQEDLQYRNVANILRGAVQVGHPISQGTMGRLVKAAVADIESADPNTVSHMLVALAKMSTEASLRDRLVLTSLRKLDRLLEACEARELVNSVWAVASMGIALPVSTLKCISERWSPRILELLAREPAGPVWAQHVGNILWALAQLRLDPGQGRFFQEVLSKLEPANASAHMESQHLSNVLLAAGQMQRRNFTPGFLNQALGKLLADGNTQELVNTLWSLSAMGLMKGNVFSSILDKLVQLNDPLTLSHARQILMAYTLVASAESNLELRSASEDLINQCRALLQEQATAPLDSSFHGEVSSCLESMMVPHALEFKSPDCLISVDIVTRCGDGSPLAIEVDGDLHFTALPPFRAIGHTMLRNALLTTLGFKGLSIPFYDWQELATTQSKTQYLAKRLEQFGVVLEEQAVATNPTD